MKFASLFAIVSLLGTAPVLGGSVLEDKLKTGSANASAKAGAAPGGVNILEGDFLTGFETGIFLRKDKKQLDEYGCPKAEIKMEEFKKIRDLLPNVKNIIKVMGGNS